MTTERKLIAYAAAAVILAAVASCAQTAPLRDPAQFIGSYYDMTRDVMCYYTTYADGSIRLGGGAALSCVALTVKVRQ